MSTEIDRLKLKIRKVLKRYNIARAGIFGSYARGEAKKNSDVDILIEFKGGLLSLVGLEMELKKKLKKRVDLLTYRGINPLLRKSILKEEIRII